MLAMQTMVAPDGKEICLFPFEYMYISQNENGQYSHANTYNIDFLGWGANGHITHCPFYAPCTLRCVAIWDAGSNTRVYQSVNPVHLADGTVDYLTINFTHDDNPPHNVGDMVLQGALLGRTGTTGNVTGDHIHSCCGKGQYEGFTRREPGPGEAEGHFDLTNRAHYYDCCYVNDTVIVDGAGNPWVEYNGRIGRRGKKKFPWVLYARKLRNKHNF